MAGRIREEDIQALRERADLAALAGSYTALRRAGTKLKGLCPFHAEKTPSFTVDPTANLFHCFGCGVGGDAYAFLMQIEALTFPEAVERLARSEGFDLTYTELRPGQRKALGRRTRLYEVLAAAAAFYRRQLHEDEGGPARAYLRRRGVDEEAARTFGLGWAPDSWDALVRHLSDQRFSQRDIADAGLATEGPHGLIDRFRGRVVFPIYERAGRDVVGFGGRVLPDVALRTGPRDGAPPKYINSSETDVYRKSEILYGLSWARADIQREGAVLIVEGYMDVIGLHLAGVRNAVATCGTALTADHLRQLEQFNARLVLALDADDAGFAAAERARALAEEAGVREVGVLPLPPDQDPADLAAGGTEAVRVALKGVKTAVEFQLEHLLREADTTTPEGQVAAYRQTFPLLARLEDRFLRYSYIRDLVAPAVRLSADRIEQELDQELLAASPRAPASVPPQAAAPASHPRPGDVAGPVPRDPQLILEREVLLAALQHPDLLPDSWDEVTAEDFRAPMSRQLHAALRAAAGQPLQAVLEALPDDELRARVRALALSDPTVDANPGRLGELVARLRAAAFARRIEAVRDELSGLNDRTDGDRRRELMARLQDLERRRRHVVEERGA